MDSLPKLCECGCGQPVPIAKQTDRRKGHIKGEPVRFLPYHHNGIVPANRYGDFREEAKPKSKPKAKPTDKAVFGRARSGLTLRPDRNEKPQVLPFPKLTYEDWILLTTKPQQRER